LLRALVACFAAVLAACASLPSVGPSAGAAAADARLVPGNRARLLVDGPKTFGAIEESLRQARDTVDIEIYAFADDPLGRRFADLLIDRQRDGVQVNLIYDAVGSVKTPSAFFERMHAAGIRIVEFNPIDSLKGPAGWRINDRDHRKLIIVDGKTVFTGGVNVSDVYSSYAFGHPRHQVDLPWRDTEVEITGPVAHSFQKIFMSDWALQGGAPLAGHDYFPRIGARGTQAVRAISSEAGGAASPVYVTLISEIRAAQRSVHITTAYFAPDPQLLEALAGAARRGVDVVLILPSRNDFWPALYTGRSYYREILSPGVRIFEREHALLHAKTAVIDGRWSTIGSTNLDWRSLSLNAEINAVVVGRGFAAEMERLFHRDLELSRHITLAQWRRRAPPERFMEFLGRLTERLM
jgi:cardiolipin synthase